MERREMLMSGGDMLLSVDIHLAVVVAEVVAEVVALDATF